MPSKDDGARPVSSTSSKDRRSSSSRQIRRRPQYLHLPSIFSAFRFLHRALRNFMDFEGRKFGMGPRELGGAVDLINKFKLWPHHDLFCKNSLPLSIADTHYLHNVVGDTEIRKGEDMELDQLFQDTSRLSGRNAHINPFDLNLLWGAFQMREATSVSLRVTEKGISTAVDKSKAEPKEKEKMHKKHQDNKGKRKDHKKHKHREKERDSDKNRSTILHKASVPENLKAQTNERHGRHGGFLSVRR